MSITGMLWKIISMLTLTWVWGRLCKCICSIQNLKGGRKPLEGGGDSAPPWPYVEKTLIAESCKIKKTNSPHSESECFFRLPLVCFCRWCYYCSIRAGAYKQGKSTCTYTRTWNSKMEGLIVPALVLFLPSNCTSILAHSEINTTCIYLWEVFKECGNFYWASTAHCSNVHAVMHTTCTHTQLYMHTYNIQMYGYIML